MPITNLSSPPFPQVISKIGFCHCEEGSFPDEAISFLLTKMFLRPVLNRICENSSDPFNPCSNSHLLPASSQNIRSSSFRVSNTADLHNPPSPEGGIEPELNTYFSKRNECTPGRVEPESNPAGNAVNQTIICLTTVHPALRTFGRPQVQVLYLLEPQISFEPGTWNLENLKL